MRFIEILAKVINKCLKTNKLMICEHDDVNKHNDVLKN